jgi:phenylpropionate dioxygenase-like ring-hydroxylating dioxygenase large terminal subunit
MTLATGLADAQLLSEWFAVGWSGEVMPGARIARQAMGRDLVLWRSTEGRLHCWLDLCIHRGARLSLGILQNHVEGNCLTCPYHGWRYAESGQCVFIPAQPELAPPLKARAQTFRVEERFGAIWACFGEPSSDLPAFPVAEDPNFRVLLAGPYRFRALGPRLIENFLDVAHLGIVHSGLLGDPERSKIEDYEVTAGQRGPEAEEIRIWQPNPDGTGTGATVAYHYQIQGPLTASFVKLHQAEGGEQRFGILAQVTPVDAEFSEMRMIMALNYGHEIADAELIAFQDYVANQDRAIVESQRPELLPLDLQAELHLRSDRLAIAYRKWLAHIGLQYGVA